MYVDTLPWHKQYVNRKSGNGSGTPDSKGVKDLGQKKHAVIYSGPRGKGCVHVGGIRTQTEPWDT